MGKRKSAAPQKADAAKRKLLTWNMTDDFRPLDIDDSEVGQYGPASAKLPGTSKSSASPAETVQTDTDVLDTFIGYSDFYFPVQTKVKVKPSDWHCHLATINLHLSAAIPGMDPCEGLPETETFYLYVNMDAGQLLAYFETVETDKEGAGIMFPKVRYYTAEAPGVAVGCFEALKQKVYCVTLAAYDAPTCSMTLQVHVLSGALTHVKSGAESTGKPKQLNTGLMHLMAQFYGLTTTDYTGATFTKKQNIEEVLWTVRHLHDNDPPPPSVNVQHPSLRPTLRDYQKKAVSWMLHKERYGYEHAHKRQGELHPLYSEITSVDNQTLYFNKHGGYLTRDKPLWMESPPGGILADEMGLGKTVEILALILLHPRPGDFRPAPRPVVAEEELQKGKKKRRSRGKKQDGDNSERSSPISDESTSKASTPKSKNTSSRKTRKAKLKAKNSLKEDMNEKSEGTEGEIDNSLPGTYAETESESSISLSYSENSGDVEVKVKDEETGNYWNNIEERRQTFECICGEHENLTSCHIQPGIVQCEMCTLWQHAACVHYDLTDAYRGRFLCPHCHVTCEPIHSKATLIITPQAISHQWVDEILKHILSDSLNVFVYTGVHKQGYIQPQKLASQDLVITTYETLRKEIDYVDLPHSNGVLGGRQLRRPKRYMATPSPMPAVQWWRVCLDEAQMVEKTTTKTAEMALRLAAINRWCVTGTPIQKGLEDAYGLLLFLGLDPYWVHQWWTKLLLHPFCYGDKEALLRVLADVLWRSAKRDVIAEINLPAQTEHVHWLKFSPVEKHFYKSQYQKCELDATRQLRKYSDGSVRLNSLDRYSLSKLLLPLTKIRQACCHPQAVKGEFVAIQKTTMTMDEVLQQLIKKTKLECEEAHRQYVAANNGIAALCIIRNELATAVEHYRENLRSISEHQGKVRTDELQQLHTLHNLHQILQRKPPGVSPTLRDSELMTEAEEIRTKYQRKAEGLAAGALEAWLPLQRSVSELSGSLESGENWWIEVIETNSRHGLDQELTHAVKQALYDNAMPDFNSIVRKFSNGRGLMLALSQALDALQSMRTAVTGSVMALREAASDRELVGKIVECCLRPVAAPANTCAFCAAHRLFEEYEGKLFCFKDKSRGGAPETEDVKAVGGSVTFHTMRQGTWADSETEKCLKALLSFARSWGAERRLIEFGQVHVKLMEALRKEFKPLRLVWSLLKEQVQSVDELDMATTRVRLRLASEKPRDPPQPGIIEPHTVDTQRAAYQADSVLGKNTLKKKLGLLRYLQNLGESAACLETGSNPDPCPICENELGHGWAVLRCGHCYCLKCIQLMIERYSFGPVANRAGQQMKCPQCRQKTRHADIAYVNTRKSRDAEIAPEHTVEGDHSSKVSGVVRCLLKIQRDDPDAKALVFSTWQDVLNLLGRALEDNHIPYRSLTNYKFQENLSSFKTESEVKVLLLPVHSGANGLNLIEATHVLLVEPILNPAQELQAIGRVHRIGQTKPTFVHRFLVRSTIEERMHGLLQSTDTPPDDFSPEHTSFTIDDFKALFREDEHTESDDENEDVIVQNSQSVDVTDSNTANDDVSREATNNDAINSNVIGQNPRDGEVTGNGHATHTHVENDDPQPSTSALHGP